MGHAQLPMNMSQSHGETRSGKGYCNDREGFFCTESQSRKIARPSLFRLNSINHEEKLKNLLLLLSNYVTQMQKCPKTTLMKWASSWQGTSTKYEWYIGYIKDNCCRILCGLFA